MPSKMDGPGIAAVAVGAIFLYGGIKGYSPLKAIENVVTGKNPNEGQSTQLLTAATTANSSSSLSAYAGGASSYNQSSLITLWEQAGGSSSSANNAACHAMQESSGNPKITSSNPDGGTNVGLWQLDTNGVGAGHTVAELQNPLTNAQITVRATNDGADWSQWATPGC